jgi:hypothetical protein
MDKALQEQAVKDDVKKLEEANKALVETARASILKSDPSMATILDTLGPRLGGALMKHAHGGPGGPSGPGGKGPPPQD